MPIPIRTWRRWYREPVSAPDGDQPPASLGAPQPAVRRAPADAATRVTGVIVVGMSVAVWWPAFTLGAWGDFFFDQELTVWAAATGAFIVVLVQPNVRHRLGKAIALLVPTLWLVLTFVAQPDDGDFGALLLILLGGLVAFLAVPATMWVLARIIWPEFGNDISWSRRFAVIGAVALIAVASFLLGANQSKFLTCQDFSISGNSEPPGCTPAPPDDVGGG